MHPLQGDERPTVGPSGKPLVSASVWRVPDRAPERVPDRPPDKQSYTATLKWKRFQPLEEAWEDFRYRHIDGPLSENVDKGRLMNALFTALPNEALAYMREHQVPKNLESLLWHMELLYGTSDQDFSTRRQAVMSQVRRKDEPARHFSRRILLKAVQATLGT